jgi:hypothetical protein
MDAADQELFGATLRRAIGSQSGADLDAALEGLGWHEALALDAPLAVSLLFERQGATNVSSSALGAVLASALGVAQPATGGVVLPALGTWHPPGAVAQGTLSVRGIGTTALLDQESVLVVAESAGRTIFLDVPSAGLAFRPVRGLDPRLGLVDITGAGLPVDPEEELDPSGWSRAVARCQLALGHELVGASRTMLELARAHALSRVQFGQTISGFQAVRHRLAETLVAIETAQAMLTTAWVEESPESAGMAKALAGRGARTAARHCQQVLAGIGFTTEHDLHLYIRRILVLDQLFGTAQTLTRELGTQLLRTRQLMALPPL